MNSLAQSGPYIHADIIEWHTVDPGLHCRILGYEELFVCIFLITDS